MESLLFASVSMRFEFNESCKDKDLKHREEVKHSKRKEEKCIGVMTSF